MSRKHFRLLAEGIANLSNRKEARKRAKQWAAECLRMNSRFDKKRFYQACGL